MLKFAKNLAAWATTNNTKEVIILSGVDAGKRPMQDVGRYVSLSLKIFIYLHLYWWIHV